jgi:ATP-binding cassette, subfamily B, multidrug efflux pump
VVMEDGRIVEQGDHDDLIRRHGVYYALYNSQFTEAAA